MSVEDLQKRIKVLMAEHGMKSRADLSRLTGLNKNTVDNIFKITRKEYPYADQFKLLSEAFNMTMDELFTGEKKDLEYLPYDPPIQDILNELQGLDEDQLTELKGLIRNYKLTYFIHQKREQHTKQA